MRNDRPAAVEHDRRQPVAARRRDPRQHDGAGEVGHERGGGPCRELGRRAELDDRAAVEHADAVPEQRRLGEVMCDQQCRHTRIAQHRDQLARGRGTRARVKRGQRLIEQQDCGLAGQRPRDRDPLALPAGELAGLRVGPVAEPEPLEQSVRPFPTLATVDAVGHVAPRAQVPEQRVVLEHVAAAPLLGRAARRRARCRARPRRRMRRRRVPAGTGPATVCSTVVLPAPDGPASARHSPVGDLERELQPGARGLELNPQHGSPA